MSGSRLLLLSLLAAAVVAVGCASTISEFSPVALDYATSLKIETLSLMDKATEPFSQHEGEVQRIEHELQKAYEYATARPRNELSAEQWRILADPEANLVGGFLALWREQSSLSEAFVEEHKPIVADAFDAIIELEAGKSGGAVSSDRRS